MESLPLRITPDSDLRRTLESTLVKRNVAAAFVIGGIGSLHQARLRFAGREESEALTGDLEILTLAGSISTEGAHLHMSIADEDGRVIGGHVAYDCIVRTTAEVLIVLLPTWSFSREPDQFTGYRELVVRESHR